MLTEILSRKECADCRVCCVFDKTDVWEMPLITSDLAARLEKDYPEIKLKQTEENARCRVIDADFDKNGLCTCPLLTEKGCALGEEKPYDCRIWPFRVMKKGNLLLLTLSPVCESVSSQPVNKLSEFAAKIAPKIFEEVKRNPEMVKNYEEGYPVFAVKEQ